VQSEPLPTWRRDYAAKPPANQILISKRVATAVEAFVEFDPEQVLRLKGCHRPVISYRVRGPKAAQTRSA
jgi:hypothetical protein